MPASMYDQLLNPQKSFLAPMLAFNNLALRLYGAVGKEHCKMMNNLMHCHAQHLQDISQAKKFEEMMQLHGEYLAKTAAPLNDYAQHMIDTILESNERYAKWLEENFQKNTQAISEGVKNTLKEGKQLQDKATGKK
ncbi:MAG: phasin family protein [Candidatus Berkiella sp.]